MLEWAAEYLEEDVSALKMWQKLIKAAGHFEFGWGVACHYQADPLADDSDNEKSCEERIKPPGVILRTESLKDRPDQGHWGHASHVV